MITKDQFHKYLTSLNLFRWTIEEIPDSFVATISSYYIPNLSDFTEVRRNEDETWYVRLAKADIYNEAITKGFFAV